jgi:EAL domain-containing protein (putative c-di-GMP-specific phosphodiesterase class I)/PAS domain-containing protein
MPAQARRAAVDTLRLLSPRMASVLVVEVGEESRSRPFTDESEPMDESFELLDADDRPASIWRSALPSILTAGRDAVALGDAAGWITYANVQACRLLEESSDKPLGTLLGTPGDPQHHPSPRLAYFDPDAAPAPVHASELAARVLACARGHYATMPLQALNLHGLRYMNESRGSEWGDKVLDIVVSHLRSGTADCGLVAPLSANDVLVVLPPPTHPADAVASVRTDLGAQRLPVIRGEDTAATGPADAGTLRASMDDGIPWTSAGTIASINADDPVIRADAVPHGGGIPWIIDSGDDASIDLSASAVNDTNVFRAPRMPAPEAPRSTVEEGLDEALRRHSMGVHYQPQFELNGGRGCGLEALCRWFLTSGDPVAPAVFIPVAERTGRVAALGAYVLKDACRTASVWKGRDAQRLTLSVNVSTLQINDDFTQVMTETLKHSGFPAQRLELEIAEGALLAADASIDRCLRAWKDLGVRLAVNHAGDNYSNLRYLSKLPVDRLKLDRSLIRGVTTNPKSAAMVNALISLGANLGIQVIAEGVETEAQFELLMALRCPQAQGYLFGRPMPLAHALVVLRKPWGNMPRSMPRPARYAAQFAS